VNKTRDAGFTCKCAKEDYVTNNKNPNQKRPGEKEEGKFHYNPGNMSGKTAGGDGAEDGSERRQASQHAVTSSEVGRTADSSKTGMDVKAGLPGQARSMSDQAMETASSLASEAGQQLHGYMDQQIAAGADLAARVASAIRAAADELDRSSPMLGGAIRSAGDRIETLSHDIRHKTVNEFVADTRSLFQRKPAMVFGMAAAVGFVPYRLLGGTQASSRETYYPTGPGARPTNSTFKSADSGFERVQHAGRVYGE
jgi:ElaB/YqjD/DUF883 family membrane-anchored ribosome-binding protein